MDANLIQTCIHCGFCLPTCPTYVLWGQEMDSPRGRITLMRQALEPGSDMSPVAVHFDRCLGCMACVTSCPSGVRYDRLIELTRPEVERRAPRPWRERAFRRACFELFTHPGRLRILAPLTPAARRLGRHVPRLGDAVRLAPSLPLRAAFRSLARRTPPVGPPRGRVSLLQGCVQRVLFSAVNQATVRVLAAEGYEVLAPSAPRCCGALLLHSGEEDEARRLARATIAALEDSDAVVVNAAGCGSAMKEYGFLLAGDPIWAERASTFSAKVRDVTELLAAAPPRAARHPLPMCVAYHDACHLAHAQAVRAEPRALLRGIPGLELAEPSEWELCCGSAGLYNLFQPEAAAELGRRKAANLLATGAEAIAAGNPGCSLQISAHLAAAGEARPVFHPVELLDASIRGASLPLRRRRVRFRIGSGASGGGRSGRS